MRIFFYSVLLATIFTCCSQEISPEIVNRSNALSAHFEKWNALKLEDRSSQRDSLSEKATQAEELFAQLIENKKILEAQRLANAMAEYWRTGDNPMDGYKILQRVSELGPDERNEIFYARTLLNTSKLAFELSDRSPAYSFSKKAIEIYDKLNHLDGQGLARIHQCRLYLRDKNFDKVFSVGNQATKLLREAGNLDARVDALHIMASSSILQNDRRTALDIYRGCYEKLRESGDLTGQVEQLSYMARMSLAEKNYHSADSMLKAAIVHFDPGEDLAITTKLLLQFSGLFAETTPPQAASFLAAVETIMAKYRYAFDKEDFADYHRYLGKARGSMDIASFNQLFESSKPGNLNELFEGLASME